MSDDDVKRRFLELPEDKQQRIYDKLAQLFARLEADWKSKPENAGKTVPYRKLWDDFSSQKREGEQGGAGYPPKVSGPQTPDVER